MAHPGIRAIVVITVLSLCACTPGGNNTTPTQPGTTSAGPGGMTETPSPDTETTAPAPPPSPTSLPPGPGSGNAELAIMVKPSASEPAVNYTLVCVDGAPAAESQHPDAARACELVKNNPAALTPQVRGKDEVCTLQYGGPATAVVTGIADNVPVDSSFALRDGCEISRWNAARSVLGSAGTL